jgi:predicted transcriptional regulator
MTIKEHGTALSPDTPSLFARKGEASPLGGRPALHRQIAMPRCAARRSAPARLTGELKASKRDVMRRLPAARKLAGLAVRGPARPALPTTRKHSETKRTTLRLDDALRTRLGRFADSKSQSVQMLLTRALARYLPTIHVQSPGAWRRNGAPNKQPAADARAPRDGGGRRTQRSVRFDPHLYWRLKNTAASRKRSMQSIMVEALTAYLEEIETTEREQVNGPDMARQVKVDDISVIDHPVRHRLVIRDPQRPRLVGSMAQSGAPAPSGAHHAA